MKKASKMFWDSSAIVSLLNRENHSQALQKTLKMASSITVWWATRVECESAIRRRQREGTLIDNDFASVRTRLELFFSVSNQVEAHPVVKKKAIECLAKHPLKAADALQLAAALTWVDDDADGVNFMTLDKRLSKAALLEGFTTPLHSRIS